MMHHFSVKKGLTQPPMAIPSTIKHNNVQMGQVSARLLMRVSFK
jgi:hypothetical protein